MKRSTATAYLLVLPIAAGLIWLMNPVTNTCVGADVAVCGSSEDAAPLSRMAIVSQPGDADGASQVPLPGNSPAEDQVESEIFGSGESLSYVPLAFDASDTPPATQGNREWVWTESRDLERWRYDDRERPDLRGFDFRKAKLGYADLAYADLEGANLDGADLRYALLHKANLKDANMKKTYLASADLREAVLQGVRMGPVNLIGADLRGADLRDAQLACSDCSTWSTLSWSNLKGANLNGADFGSSLIHDSVFEKADLRGANLADAHGVPRSMRGALYDDDTRLPKKPVKIEPKKWEMVYAP